MKMIQRTVALTEPIHRWVRSEAERLGTSEGDVIRRVLDAAREAQAQKGTPRHADAG